MEPFIRKYQPNRIDAWVNNHDWDFHPEDPPHLKRAYEVSNSYLFSFGIYIIILGFI